MSIAGYEWDEQKRQATLEAREVDFADAAKADWDNALTREDARKDYSERRFITFAEIANRLFAIGWTERGNSRRIFSMRKANTREQELFYAKDDDDDE